MEMNEENIYGVNNRKELTSWQNAAILKMACRLILQGHDSSKAIEAAGDVYDLCLILNEKTNWSIK